jgi:hypothetical protein
MLLPLYLIDMGSWRDLAAILAALSFVIFLFWHLNLHYMNLLFAVFGYRVYTICPPMNTSSISSRASYALITRRTTVAPGDRLIAYRLSDTVYFEVQE